MEPSSASEMVVLLVMVFFKEGQSSWGGGSWASYPVLLLDGAGGSYWKLPTLTIGGGSLSICGWIKCISHVNYANFVHIAKGARDDTIQGKQHHAQHYSLFPYFMYV